MNLEKALSIELIVAEFAYSELPKFFSHILGVTGTLRAMPDVKKSILYKDYAFENNYIIPSSFGLNEKQKYEYFIVEESKFE